MNLHARTPINRQAAKVVSDGPDHQLTKMKSSCTWDSDLPIATTQPPQEAEDHKGHTWGRLTVIGYHSSRRNKKFKEHKWVVRCSCGRFSIRTHRAIKAKRNPDECCGHCEYLKIVRKRYARNTAELLTLP